MAIRDLMFKGARFRVVAEAGAPVKEVVWVRAARDTRCELEVKTEGGGVSLVTVALDTLVYVEG